MQKTVKAGLLVLLLVVPAFVFLFLKGYGRNQYRLKTYYPVVDSATGLPVIKQITRYGRAVDDTLFRQVPPFAFTDQDGKPFSSAAIDGKIYVADFFFARCPGSCPRMSSQLRRVQDIFVDNPRVQLLSFTVDPAHDTVAVLRRYADQYQARLGKWTFLTGPKRDLYALAQQGFFIAAREDLPTAANLEDQFVHSSKLILVDSRRHIRGYYDGLDPKDVDRMVLEMRILLEMEKETQ